MKQESITIEKQNWKIDWGSYIVDIVKKKDLDGHDFANCWEEDYDWADLDCYVINNYEEEVISYAKNDYPSWDRAKLRKDLMAYRKQYGDY